MVLQPQDMPLKAGLKVLGDSVSETGVCRWGEGLLEKVPAAGVSAAGDAPSHSHTHKQRGAGTRRRCGLRQKLLGPRAPLS